MKLVSRQAIRARFTDDDLAPALLFIAFAVLACMTPAQNDTFWHLRSGQYMWQTGSVLMTEPFSHSAYGAPLHNHWWLSQLVFYLTYSFGGPFLLTILAGSCAFAAVAGSWRLMGRSFELRAPRLPQATEAQRHRVSPNRTLPVPIGLPGHVGRPDPEPRVPSPGPRAPAWELRVALLVWLMVVTAGEWSIRPQVVSLALLVLTAHLIARDRLVWLPVVCVLWANAHAMVIFGVAMSGAVAFEALLWSRTNTKRALVVAAACVAAPMISPLGWHYWPQILSTVSVSRELQIQEYQMPLQMSDLPFWAVLASLLVVVVLNRHRLRDCSPSDRALLIASLILAVAAVTASRNVAFFAVIAAPVVSRLYPVKAVVSRRPARPVGLIGWGVALGGILGGGLVVAAVWRDDGQRLGWQPISPATIEVVRRCPDPIFNQMADGGPLMWALPHRRVFVDSRMEAYPLELLRRSREVDLGGDHTELFREYRFGCAIATTGSLLAEHLAEDPSMSLIHSDLQRSVFARLSVVGN